MVITSADDNLEKGQFRRLKVSGSFLEFSIKVPTQDGWKWITVKKLLPNRLRKALRKAKQIKAPLIKKVQLKSGYTIYKLVLLVSFEITQPKEINRVLAIDLSLSNKRLSPIFFKTELVRKKEFIKKSATLRRE